MSVLSPYSKDNPPKSCLMCDFHTRTYANTTGCHTYWHDSCGLIRMPFAKLHIFLHGEYRSLAKHDEGVLEDFFPYECPYFDPFRLFWESYGRIKMNFTVFIYECAMHPESYKNMYVYSLPATIDYISTEISDTLGLVYIKVSKADSSWFITTFGGMSVMLSYVNPYTWVLPTPSKPI